jgi:hypothetical protein
LKGMEFMGEIKSTLDLVMEKTRGLTMSAGEKQQLKEEQAAQRARGLFLKYKDGFWSLEGLQRQVEREPDADEVKKQVSLLMIESLEPNMAETAFLNDMKAWLGAKSSEALDEASRMLEEFRSKTAALDAEAEDRIRSELEKAGISGSAVKPKANENGQWRRLRDELAAETGRTLETIKERLRNSL